MAVALATELDELFPAELGGLQSPEAQREKIQARGFRAAERSPDVRQIRSVKIDAVSECLGRGKASVYRFPLIDLALNGPRPKLRVTAAQEGLTDLVPFASDLDTPGARRKLGYGRHFVCSMCAVRGRNVAYWVVEWSAHAVAQ